MSKLNDLNNTLDIFSKFTGCYRTLTSGVCPKTCRDCSLEVDLKDLANALTKICYNEVIYDVSCVVSVQEALGSLNRFIECREDTSVHPLPCYMNGCSSCVNWENGIVNTINLLDRLVPMLEERRDELLKEENPYSDENMDIDAIDCIIISPGAPTDVTMHVLKKMLPPGEKVSVARCDGCKFYENSCNEIMGHITECHFFGGGDGPIPSVSIQVVGMEEIFFTSVPPTDTVFIYRNRVEVRSKEEVNSGLVYPDIDSMIIFLINPDTSLPVTCDAGDTVNFKEALDEAMERRKTCKEIKFRYIK